MAVSWQFKDFKTLITDYHLVVNYLRLQSVVSKNKSYIIDY